MNDCLEWPRSRFRSGYGQATADPGRTTRLAHRREWERANGPIPEQEQGVHQHRPHGGGDDEGERPA
jgi:hypothetical protein